MTSTARAARSGSVRWWPWLRMVLGAGLLAVLVWRLGTGPFLDGLRRVSGWPVLAAVVIAVPTTVCCAWRWSLVARGLGVQVPLPAAVASYYRSQFLNSTLPGGVIGDVHRGVRHGREVGDIGRSLRAVAWERSAGQIVQVALALTTLLVLPSPVRSAMPIVLGALVLLAAAAWVATRIGSRRSGFRRAVAADIRHGLLARSAWPGVLLASTVVVIGHVVTFVIAARTAGVTASTAQLLPLALLVLLAMGVPTNVGGWGPREGVAGWAFGAAGLGATQGVATAVVYGVITLAASLPGAAVLLLGGWSRRHGPASRVRPIGARAALHG